MHLWFFLILCRSIFLAEWMLPLHRFYCKLVGTQNKPIQTAFFSFSSRTTLVKQAFNINGRLVSGAFVFIQYIWPPISQLALFLEFFVKHYCDVLLCSDIFHEKGFKQWTDRTWTILLTSIKFLRFSWCSCFPRCYLIMRLLSCVPCMYVSTFHKFLPSMLWKLFIAIIAI